MNLKDGGRRDPQGAASFTEEEEATGPRRPGRGLRLQGGGGSVLQERWPAMAGQRRGGPGQQGLCLEAVSAGVERGEEGAREGEGPRRRDPGQGTEVRRMTLNFSAGTLILMLS